MKEIKSFGKDANELFVMTDGYHEVNAKLTQQCKRDIKERYPP